MCCFSICRLWFSVCWQKMTVNDKWLLLLFLTLCYVMFMLCFNIANLNPWLWPSRSKSPSSRTVAPPAPALVEVLRPVARLNDWRSSTRGTGTGGPVRSPRSACWNMRAPDFKCWVRERERKYRYYSLTRFFQTTSAKPGALTHKYNFPIPFNSTSFAFPLSDIYKLIRQPQ